MGLCFAAGAACFVIGPIPGYANLVGAGADGATFFIGSILFTLGGALQSWLALPGRNASGRERAEWRAALAQSAGTLCFNVTTYRAMHTAITSAHYDKQVWRPDAIGSLCFLVSGVIAYRAGPRTGWLPARTEPGWWEPSINLLGCLLFGFAAIAGHVEGSTGSLRNASASNWTTALGALC